MNKMFRSMPKASNAVGRRLPRIDAISQVTGQMRFAGDIRLPGMLHVKFLRSRFPHARILRIDTSRAAKAPGIAAVITAADVPFNGMGVFRQDQPILAGDRVRYLGDPVVAVAGEIEKDVVRAIDLIDVEYEELPAVFDPVRALDADAPVLHGSSNLLARQGLRCGDVEAAFASSHLVVEENYRTQVIEQCTLETQIVVVDPATTDGLTIYTPSSRPFAVRAEVARVLDVDPIDLHVVGVPAGGAFGGKSDAWLEPVAAVIAAKTGRPIMAKLTRGEEFFASTVRHPIIMQYCTGVDTEGRILARRVRLILDTGPYGCLGETTLRKSALMCAGPYRIPNIDVEGLLVHTNNSVSSAMRGFGVPQVCFAWESHTETIARRLGMDSFRFRMLNAIDSGDVAPGGQMLSNVGLKASMRQALATFASSSGRGR
jgi:CO/xanthine dehydrogenase Mo-binding subunit